MPQTPAPLPFDPNLLALLPRTTRRVVQVGGNGLMAREFKRRNPGIYYTSIHADAAQAQAARAHCDRAVVLDVETVTAAQLGKELAADCWVFDHTLEQLRDPWALLARLRQSLPARSTVIAAVTNAQHWSVQAQLATGAFSYNPDSPIERAHIRWFTRETLIELFDGAGLPLETLQLPLHDEPQAAPLLPIIGRIAQTVGADADQAIADASARYYLARAVLA